MKLNKIFLLSWKKLALIIVAWIVCVVAHNLGSSLLGFEEPVFFLLAVIVIPIYFIISVIYSIIVYIRNKLKLNKGKLTIKKQ